MRVQTLSQNWMNSRPSSDKIAQFLISTIEFIHNNPFWGQTTSSLVVVNMGDWSSHGDSLDQRHHRRGNGLDHWGCDEGLLVDLGVALVGDGMGQGLQHGHSGHMVDSGSHIGLVVHNGSHVLNDGHNGGSHMVNNGSHMLDHRNHWTHSLDHGNGRNHMLHHGSEHSLVVELGEALVGSGNGSRVHDSSHLGHNGGRHGHMVLLNESRSGSGNGGQGTDGNL